MSPHTIRPATRADIETLIAFTLAEARDAEGIELDRAAVTRGVTAALDDPRLARYWAAETSNGEVVASTSIVTEWSNFRGGNYWWVQSLYIVPAHRGQGLVERLLDHLATEAAASSALELRLYAHAQNERALKVYRRADFTDAPYVIMRRSVAR
jgi:ribosomal protein S18 acetylase RimI-like enzyme